MSMRRNGYSFGGGTSSDARPPAGVGGVGNLPTLWWSPTVGLVRGPDNGGHEDAEQLVPYSRITDAVGAELRTQADKFADWAGKCSGTMHYTYAGAAAELRARAEEIDPGGAPEVEP